MQKEFAKFCEQYTGALISRLEKVFRIILFHTVAVVEWSLFWQK
jgi:hypothetical protein